MEDIKVTQSTWWCKKCNAFTIFDISVPNEEHCIVCKSKLENYNIKDIPAEVLHDQHIKYIAYRNMIARTIDSINHIDSNLNYLNTGHRKYSNWTDEDKNREIKRLNTDRDKYIDKISCCKETDAGIISAEESTRIRCTVNNVDRIIYLWQSKGINNNDPCHCGSGKKFKKCCRK